MCASNSQCFSNDCTLDDFGTSGLKYCVPNAPAHCAKESSWYEINKTFCVAAGGTTYKKCTPDSWGTAINCTNTATRGCTPTSYVNQAGYLSPDSCSDTGSGAVCNVDAVCDTCSYTQLVKIPGGTKPVYQTSVYTFETPGCLRTCLNRFGAATDALCGQAASPNSHFCYKTTSGTKDVGVCFRKLKSGAACEADNWCVSGSCNKGVCGIGL